MKKKDYKTSCIQEMACIHERRGQKNTLVIVLIAAVLLTAAYAFYGRWLSKKWGIDPKAETPAHKFEDGQDYVQLTVGQYLAISFHLLLEQAL